MTTNIEWADETINPIVGCSRISEGCANCYAAKAAVSPRLQQFPQYQKVSKWDGTVELVESQLLKPLGWRSPKRIFVCSMSDLFHSSIPDEWRDKVFAVMAIAPWHTYQVLTKRPDRMKEYFTAESAERVYRLAHKLLKDGVGGIEKQEFVNKHCIIANSDKWWPLKQVWLGVSVENQKAADSRIPLLMEIPAKVRFLSCEPLLEPLDLSKFLPIEWSEIAEDWIQSWPEIGSYSTNDYPNWIIVGLESGSNARRCDLQAVHSIINQCQTAKVKVFCKQLGTVWAKESGTYKQDRKGASPELWDKSFNVQEFPNC